MQLALNHRHRRRHGRRGCHPAARAVQPWARGGSGNTSQKLMRARVIGQAIALALLMAALFFFGNGNHGS